MSTSIININHMTQKTYNHYQDGKLVATYNEPIALARRKLSLIEMIANHKRARRDARLVNILSK